MRTPPLALVLALVVPLSLACASSGARSAAAPPSTANEAAWGDVTSQVPGFVRELRSLDVTLPSGVHVKLDTLITRPAVEDRLPLIVLTHSRPAAADRAAMTPTTFSMQSLALARHGYGVAVVLRRGYGRSSGPEVDSPGKCSDSRYERSARSGAEDLVAAVQALGQEPWVDPAKVVVVGMGSMSGGLSALAAPALLGPESKALAGVISVTSYNLAKLPEAICQEDRLVAAMAALGQTARAPALFVEGTNAEHFREELARRLSDAYKAGGAPVELTMAPFDSARPDPWWPSIVPFLTRLGLPTADPDPSTVQTNAALEVPPNLDDKGRKAFAEYLATDGFEKAFVVGNRSWGRAYRQRTMTDAMYKAVQLCQAMGDRGCRPYAVGDEYAPDMKEHPPVHWVLGWCTHHTHSHWNDAYRCWTNPDAH